MWHIHQHQFQPPSSAPTSLVAASTSTSAAVCETEKTLEEPDFDLKRIKANAPALAKVDWSHKGIKDDRVVKLVKALDQNTHVTNLDLFGNDVTDVSAKDLEALLRRNTTITKINLGATKVSADIKTKIHRLGNINEESCSPEEARRRKNIEFESLPRRKDKQQRVAPQLGTTTTRVKNGERPSHVNMEGRRHHHSKRREGVVKGGGYGSGQEQGDRELAQKSQRKEQGRAGGGGKMSFVHALSTMLLSGKSKGLPSQAEKESAKQYSAADAGREIMRKAIETPNYKPRPIPLQYIKESTENFVDERRLGEGSFSWVFEGKDKDLRQKFAVKRLRVQGQTDVTKARETFEREIVAMKYFRHPNIARLYAYHLDSDCACLLYELASRGSLDQVIADKVQRKQFHWTKRISAAMGIAKALEYMHGGTGDQICFHRDVKASNVCLKRDFTALLIDCGVAKMTPVPDAAATMTLMESTGNGMRGTPGYICPDYSVHIAQEGSYKYSSANDVFSLGVVMTEIFTGVLQNSFKDGKKINVYYRYSREKMNMKKDVDKSGEDWDLITKRSFTKLAVECMSLKPEERPSISKIVEQLSELESKARPRSPGEQNSITVLVSSPLVYSQDGFEYAMIDALNFGLERDLLEACIKESKRDIRLIFDTATIDRLQIAATKRCGCLHFSGHGFPDKLAFEDGTGGACWLDKQGIRDYVHQKPFTLVFVSACYSRYMGMAFVEAGVKHVVCCKYNEKIKDGAAIKFTHHFYMALAEGYTIRNAFEKGKDAARKCCVKEANKFLLLPHDGNHDVQVFHAENLEWDESMSPSISIPPVPEHFLGREVDMYRVLQLVLNHRLVHLVGDRGIGCSSLASAVCHYIKERKSSILSIDSIYFLRGQDQISDLLKQLHGQLVTEGRVKCSPNEDDSRLADRLVSALSRVKALIVLDDITVEDSLSISLFIARLLGASNSIRLLMVTTNEVNITSPYAVGRVYKLGPLNLAPTVTLFGKACRHVGRNTSFDLLLDRVAPSGSLCGSIFKKIGGGVPARILEAAKHFQKEEYELLFLAPKPNA